MAFTFEMRRCRVQVNQAQFAKAVRCFQLKSAGERLARNASEASPPTLIPTRSATAGGKTYLF
eukprot:3935338-Amphidinium_carterae.1